MADILLCWDILKQQESSYCLLAFSFHEMYDILTQGKSVEHSAREFPRKNSSVFSGDHLSSGCEIGPGLHWETRGLDSLDWRTPGVPFWSVRVHVFHPHPLLESTIA